MSFWLALLLVFASCRTDYFSQPLPVDAPDLTITPAPLRGTFRFAEDNDTMTVQLMKRSLIITQSSPPVHYVKGVWPCRIGYKGVYALPDGYIPEFEIRYDSMYQLSDTQRHFLIHNDRLYPVKQNEMGLQAGLPFQTDQDTLTTMNPQINVVDLGRRSFFRRVSKDCFVLNLGSAQQTEEPGWWFLYVITVEDWGLQLREILPENSDSLKLHFFNDDADKYSSYYYDLHWTIAQMRQKRAAGEFPASGRFIRIK